jgi:CheY-like chemotaxis protein
MSENGRRRILVVDDTEEIRALLRRLVERWGYACEEAFGGRSALARLDAGAFALVLTDYDMADGDGLTLIRDVVRRGRTGAAPVTPIILVSGSATDDVCDEAVAAGADAVFRKPFEPAFLRAAIALLIDGSEDRAAG